MHASDSYTPEAAYSGLGQALVNRITESADAGSILCEHTPEVDEYEITARDNGYRFMRLTRR